MYKDLIRIGSRDEYLRGRSLRYHRRASDWPELQDTDVPSIDIVLELTAEQCLAHYRGAAQKVHARSVGGKRVQFPAQALRRILGPDGVHGVFRLRFTEAGRFESLTPVRV